MNTQTMIGNAITAELLEQNSVLSQRCIAIAVKAALASARIVELETMVAERDQLIVALQETAAVRERELAARTAEIARPKPNGVRAEYPPAGTAAPAAMAPLGDKG